MKILTGDTHFMCYYNFQEIARMAAQLPSRSEKREFPRMALNRLVQIQEESGNTKRLVGLNYSLGGMALHSQNPLPLGEFIDLSFRLNEHEMKILDMTGEVMQNFKEGNAYIAGIKFVGYLPLNSASDVVQ